MHKNIIKISIIIVCFTIIFFFLSACSNQNISKVEPTNDMEPKEIENTIKMMHRTIPNGIYYNGQIYWDIDYEKTDNLPNSHLGFLQGCAENYQFPITEFMGTNSLSESIGKDIFLSDNALYMMIDDDVHVFRYLKQKNVGVEEKERESNVDDGTPAPHFVYNDMTYCIYDELESEIPKNFHKVGEITDTYHLANKNFTGSIDVGSELYATDFQNRFMLVRYKNMKGVYVFQNSNYTE